MSGEENKAMLRRLFEEGINGGDDAAFDELLASDYVNYDMPAPVPGPEGMKAAIGQFRAAFPDMKVQLEAVFADGDLVGTRGRFTGTHEGEFMGIPPTGSPIEVQYQDLWRVRDGKLAENWVRLDMLGLMQQLGAVPAPPNG